MSRRQATSLRLVLSTVVVLVAGCGGGGSDDGRFAFTLVLLGFPDSTAATGHYEGWAVVEGVPVSTGRFVVLGTGPDAEVRSVPDDRPLGTVSGATFGPSSTLLGEEFPLIVDAEEFFVTWEAEGDDDGEPSCVVLLAGRLVDEAATLTPEGVTVAADFPCALPAPGGVGRLGLVDLAGAGGFFQLRSFTNDLTGPQPDDHAGVWFVREDDTPSGITCGLELPALPDGLIYEAFAEVDGVARSLGRFADPTMRDLDASVAPQRGPDGPGPECPGQDFVAPTAPTHPFDPPSLLLTDDMVDVQGDYEVFVTVEPAPDNDPAPFQLRLLGARIPPDLAPGGTSTATTSLVPLVEELPTAEAFRGDASLLLENLGLEDLGAGASDRRGHYQLWVGTPTGMQPIAAFLIDGEAVVGLGGGPTFGTRASSSFPAPLVANENAVFISLEDEGDDDLVPDRILLAGLLQGSTAVLTVAGLTPGGPGLADFVGVDGTFRLRTPSNDDEEDAEDDDGRGILFGNALGQPTLDLPALPAGWRYEAFIREIGTGRVFSTGTFASPAQVDDDDAESASRGSGRKPAVPGAEFVNAVPTMALPVAGPGSITRVFVTLARDPDAFRGPSPFVILDAQVPPSAVTGGVGGIDVPLTPVPLVAATFSAQLTIEND